MTSKVLEEAADWLDRIDELSEQEQRDFAHWLKVEENKVAFHKVASAMGQLEVAKRSTALATKKISSAKNRLFDTNAEVKQQNNRHATFWSLASAACVAFIIVYFNFGNVGTISPSEGKISAYAADETQTSDVISTSVAEEKSNVLEDGSLVYQGGNSQISVAFNKEKREVKLDRGQAYFDVMHAPQRPFVVDVDTVTITVVGTAFDVEKLGLQTIIKVYEGTVRVNADRELLLNRGQKVSLENGVIQNSSKFTPNQLPSWRMGWLSIENTPISDVVTKLNRYSLKPLEYIGDPDVLISGRFNLRNTNESLSLLSLMQEFTTEQTNSGYIVRQIK